MTRGARPPTRDTIGSNLAGGAIYLVKFFTFSVLCGEQEVLLALVQSCCMAAK